MLKLLIQRLDILVQFASGDESVEFGGTLNDDIAPRQIVNVC